MIEIKNLQFSYNKNKSILNIDKLNVEHKGIYSIIGHNGAGKTTLLKILAGILKYKNGSVRLLNNEIKDTNSLELSHIRSYIPQNLYINFSINVEQFISFGAYRYMNLFSNIPYNKHKELNEILEIFDIKDIKHKSINNISGGELQKCHIARTFFQNTEVMLFDEPVSNIDINYKFKIFKLLKKISKEKLILYITHDINIALNYSDKIIALKNGRIVDFQDAIGIVKNISNIYDGEYIIEKIKNRYILIDEE